MHAAKVVVVSPTRHHHLPPLSFPFSLHRNNLVIDDVKEEKVQQLEKSEKGLWLHFIYHWCFSHSVENQTVRPQRLVLVLGVHVH